MLMCFYRSDGEMEESNICGSAHIGQHISFEAEISIDRCTASGTYNLAIKPTDLTESINIELDTTCQCDCEDEV